MLEIALRNPDARRQDARRSDGRAARRTCRSSPCAARATTSRPRPTSSSPRATSCSPSAPPRKCWRRRGKLLGEAAPGRLRQGPPRPRLPARVRLAPDRGRQGAGRSRPAGREGVRPHPGAPRRRRHPAAPRSRARVRRPRRRARQSRRFRGDAQVLRRLDQGHRGIQLHLDRHRHGARLPDRRDPASHCPASASSRSACRAC